MGDKVIFMPPFGLHGAIDFVHGATTNEMYRMGHENDFSAPGLGRLVFVSSMAGTAAFAEARRDAGGAPLLSFFLQKKLSCRRRSFIVVLSW